MVKFDYISGFNAIKHQIYRTMISGNKDFDNVRFEKITLSLLNRTAPGWIKK